MNKGAQEFYALMAEAEIRDRNREQERKRYITSLFGEIAFHNYDGWFTPKGNKASLTSEMNLRVGGLIAIANLWNSETKTAEIYTVQGCSRFLITDWDLLHQQTIELPF